MVTHNTRKNLVRIWSITYIHDPALKMSLEQKKFDDFPNGPPISEQQSLHHQQKVERREEKMTQISQGTSLTSLLGPT